MSSGTVGAKIVVKQEKQYFNCIIKKIVCHHSDDKKAVLYSHEKVKAEKENNNSEKLQAWPRVENGAFMCSISMVADPQYYFISNYRGKGIELECKREVNSCTEENHSFYNVYYEDKDSRKLQCDKHHISDSKLKLYYYDLFHRAGDFARSTAKQLSNNIANMAVPVAGVVIPNATAGAYVAGSISDFIFALRFIHLPYIKKDDDEYYCHASFYYNECPHDVCVRPIHIQIYPDIEYNLSLGIKAGKSYEGSRKEKDSIEKSASFKFSIKYNSVEKEISFENINEEKIGAQSKDKKGTKFYKIIGTLRDRFKEMHQFTKKFREEIEGPLGKSIQKGVYGIASRNLNWLNGSLELEPSLSLKWSYYVPDDLSTVRRFFEGAIEIKGTGTLTIDLIELGRNILNKSKQVAAAGAVVVAVGSGGFAAVPAILVNALVNGLITMVTNWLRKPFTAELSLSCSAELKRITFNNIENNILETSLIVEVEAKLILAMEAKVAITLSSWIEREVELEASAFAEASISVPLESKMKIESSGLSFEFLAEITPFTVKIGYGASASWNVTQKKGRKDKTNKKQFGVSESHSWEFGGWKMDPIKLVLFEPEESEKNKDKNAE